MVDEADGLDMEQVIFSGAKLSRGPGSQLLVQHLKQSQQCSPCTAAQN